MYLCVSQDTFYEIHIDLAFVFGLYLTAVGALKTFFNQFIRGTADVHPPTSRCFPYGRRYLRYRPRYHRRIFQAHDTCNERTRMYAEAQFKIRLALGHTFLLVPLDKSHHVKAGGNHVYRMGLIRYRKSPAHIYESPMVLIFSIPYFSTIRSIRCNNN